MLSLTTVTRGAAFTLAGQWGKLAIQFAGIVVLSRLLDPRDFGMYAMILAVVGVAAVFSDFGLSLAAVQAPSLSNSESSNLFWLNCCVGFAAGALVYVASYPLAILYGEPQLAPATQAVASVFALNGISAQYRALLNRRLRYRVLAVADAGSQLAGLILAVSLAAFNAGIWALVLQQIAAAGTLLVVVAAASRWLPHRPSFAGLGRFISFGFATFATQAINYISTNFASAAIGRIWGPDILGVYSRAFQLFAIPLQQLAAPMTRVALPLLTQAAGTGRYRSYLERMQLILSYPMITTLALIAGAGDPLVHVLLGAQWQDAAVYLRLLAVGGIFQVLGYVYYWAFLSKARMRILLLCEGPGRIILVVLVAASVSHGAEWAAAGYSVGLLVIWLITSTFGARQIQVSALRLTRIALRPIAIGILAAVSGWVAASLASNAGLSPVFQLTCSALLIATVVSGR